MADIITGFDLRKLENSSAITAWTNDFEFNSYFTRQVEALGNEGDIFFLITTGGGNIGNPIHSLYNNEKGVYFTRAKF